MPEIAETIFDIVIFAAIVTFCVSVSTSLRSIATELRHLRDKRNA